jgi:hypothetical protein
MSNKTVFRVNSQNRIAGRGASKKVIMLMGDSDIRQNDGCECDSCVRHCGPDPQSLQEKEAFWTPSIAGRGNQSQARATTQGRPYEPAIHKTAPSM